MHNYIVSWSGGKDSCLALHHAHALFKKPHALLTMMTEDNLRSRSHGLSREVIAMQAELMGVSSLFFAASWADYEKVFANALIALKSDNITTAVFGDIKIAHDPIFSHHRAFADKMGIQASMNVYEPLWELSLHEVVEQFLSSEISATIVAIKNFKGAKKFLGTTLTRDVCEDFAQRGLHPLGERGEFHTVVTKCPLFSDELKLVHNAPVLRDGYWFLDVALREGSHFVRDASIIGDNALA